MCSPLARVGLSRARPGSCVGRTAVCCGRLSCRAAKVRRISVWCNTINRSLNDLGLV